MAFCYLLQRIMSIMSVQILFSPVYQTLFQLFTAFILFYHVSGYSLGTHQSICRVEEIYLKLFIILLNHFTTCEHMYMPERSALLHAVWCAYSGSSAAAHYPPCVCLVLPSAAATRCCRLLLPPGFPSLPPCIIACYCTAIRCCTRSFVRCCPVRPFCLCCRILPALLPLIIDVRYLDLLPHKLSSVKCFSNSNNPVKVPKHENRPSEYFHIHPSTTG